MRRGASDRSFTRLAKAKPSSNLDTPRHRATARAGIAGQLTHLTAAGSSYFSAQTSRWASESASVAAMTRSCRRWRSSESNREFATPSHFLNAAARVGGRSTRSEASGACFGTGRPFGLHAHKREAYSWVRDAVSRPYIRQSDCSRILARGTSGPLEHDPSLRARTMHATQGCSEEYRKSRPQRRLRHRCTKSAFDPEEPRQSFER